MPSPNTLAIKAIGTVKHTFHVKHPWKPHPIKVTRLIPSYLVGKVIQEGGQAISNKAPSKRDLHRRKNNQKGQQYDWI